MGEELIWAPELRAQSIAVGRVKLAGRKEGAAGAGGCARTSGRVGRERVAASHWPSPFCFYSVWDSSHPLLGQVFSLRSV